MKENLKKLVESKNTMKVIIAIVTLGIMALIFQAGVFVGFHKASFLFRSGDNFYHVFGERENRMLGFRDEFSGAHGAIGRIVKINLPSLVVVGQDNIEKTILTSSTTEVHQAREISSVNNLAVDQYISVLGSPNDQAEIVAKFIRIVPSPKTTSNEKN